VRQKNESYDSGRVRVAIPKDQHIVDTSILVTVFGFRRKLRISAKLLIPAKGIVRCYHSKSSMIYKF